MSIANDCGMGVTLISNKEILEAISKLAEKSVDKIDHKIVMRAHRRKKRLKQDNDKAAMLRAQRKGITPYQELHILRQKLNERIIFEVKKRKMLHKELADISQTSRPRITSIMNRHLERVTTDCMIKILNILGISVTVILK